MPLAHLAVFAPFGAFAAFQIWAALSRGRLIGPGGTWLDRQDHPRTFRLFLALNGVVVALLTLLLILTVWRLVVPPPFAERASQAYPAKAANQSVAGHAVVACTVTPSFGLRDCEVVSVSPVGYRFGDAALKVAAMLTLPPKDQASVHPGEVINLPIRFKMPDGE